jgi:hypothetical protein
MCRKGCTGWSVVTFTRRLRLSQWDAQVPLGKDWRGTTGISLAGGSIEPLTSCMPCLTVSSDAVVLGRITAGQTDIRV